MIVNLQALLPGLPTLSLLTTSVTTSPPPWNGLATCLTWVRQASMCSSCFQGFIIVFTTKRPSTTAFDFLSRRAARVVPAYWLVTMATFVSLLVGLKPIGNHEDLGYLVSSLLFVPVERGAAGAIPLLAVGWTLNHERFFYLVFAAGIRVAGVARRSYFVGAVLVGLVSVGCLIERSSPAAHACTSPLLLEFLFGVMLAGFWQRIQKVSRKPLELTGLACVVLGPTLLAIHCATVPFRDLTGSLRCAWFGGPAATIVAGVLLLEAAKRTVTSKLWHVQGDASYSLYLVHPLLLHITRKALTPLPIEGGLGFAVRSTLMIAACVVCGSLFHRHVERPLTQLFTRRDPRVTGSTLGSSS